MYNPLIKLEFMFTLLSIWFPGLVDLSYAMFLSGRFSCLDWGYT